MLISIGLIALEIALYIALVKWFPILGGISAGTPERVAKPGIAPQPWISTPPTVSARSES
jgi:hypothetical protein